MASLDLHTGAGRWVVATAVLGSSMTFLDSTVVNVALPAIGRDLGATAGDLQWILSAYLLALASLILPAGFLGDRYGQRRLFRLGAALFTLASLLCAVAPGAGWLITARALQGVGGSLLTPGSLALLESNFRSQDRSRAIGAWSGLTGVASALGPLLGGYLTTAVSWRAIFLINLPIGAFVVLVAGTRLPETEARIGAGRLDTAGSALAALGLAGLTYALISGPVHGWASVAIPGALGTAAVAAFIVVERRAASPMLPLGLFASRQFSAANVVTFVVYAAIGGFFFLFVAFLQVSLHYSPLAAGAASLPVTGLMLVLSSRSGALSQRIGARVPLTLGPVVVGVGLLLMAGIGPHDAYASGILPAVVVFGLGLTLVVAPITATVLAAADTSRAGIASAVNNAVARLAGLLAVAVLPAAAGLSGRRFYVPHLMVAGFHRAVAICGALAIVAGLAAWLTIEREVPQAVEAVDEGAAAASPRADYSCAINCPPMATRGVET